MTMTIKMIDKETAENMKSEIIGKAVPEMKEFFENWTAPIAIACRDNDTIEIRSNDFIAFKGGESTGCGRIDIMSPKFRRLHPRFFASCGHMALTKVEYEMVMSVPR